jgi:hypothetical protein
MLTNDKLVYHLYVYASFFDQRLAKLAYLLTMLRVIHDLVYV